jgi:hypothetical protein
MNVVYSILFFFLGCSSGSEAIKHSVCHRSRKSRGTAYLWLWVCQAAKGREWSPYDTMLYSQFCSTGSAEAAGLWCSLRYLVSWCSPLHYAGRVSKVSCFHILNKVPIQSITCFSAAPNLKTTNVKLHWYSFHETKMLCSFKRIWKYLHIVMIRVCSLSHCLQILNLWMLAFDALFGADEQQEQEWMIIRLFLWICI